MSQQTERPRIGSVVLITTMWILVTIHGSICWAELDNIYIRHGGTQKAQLGAQLFSRYGELFLQYVIDFAVTFISLLLADITMVYMYTVIPLHVSRHLQIWRCWVLYGRRWLVVMIPGLSLVAGSGA